MKATNRMRLAVFLAVAFCAAGLLIPVDRSTTDLSILPVGPMKFQGFVSIESYPRLREQHLHSAIGAWKGGVKTLGGKMTVNEFRLAGGSDGYYQGTKIGTSLRAGSMVTVVFQPPWAGTPAWTATLAVPTLLRNIAPVSDAHIPVARPGSLSVSWSGGTPPYELRLMHFVDGHPIQILRLDSLAVGSASIPYRLFVPGELYDIYIQDGERRFAFDREVDPATRLIMVQNMQVRIHAE